MNSSANAVRSELKSAGNPDRAAHHERFFRAYPGGYGEGDRFFGVTVPSQRKIALRYRHLPLAQILRLLRDPVHECRLTALFILIDQFERGDDPGRRSILDTYLDHLDQVNNWDLVDASAPKILGAFLADGGDRTILRELAESGHLWRQRVAVVACHRCIREGDFADFLAIAESLLYHEHDLIHKAVGWMLREVGKRDEAVLHDFLRSRYQTMPRTMLRYAIERFDRPTRTAYLRGTL